MFNSDTEVNQLRARVAELEEQVKFLYQHLGISYPATQFSGAPSGDDPRIVEYLRKGNMIEAIKIHRERYNTGLAEAKTACEEIKRRL